MFTENFAARTLFLMDLVKSLSRLPGALNANKNKHRLKDQGQTTVL